MRRTELHRYGDFFQNFLRWNEGVMFVLRYALGVFLAVTAGFGILSSSARAMELFAFEAPNCGACKVFKREVLPIYAASPAGQVFPLWVVDMGSKVPFRLAEPVTFTPTFIWVDNGVEVGRFSGYRNKEQFFSIVNEAANSQGRRGGMRRTGAM